MKRLIQFKTTTPLLLIPLLLVCFACLPSTQAVTPAPDGAYPGYNTAEGLNALAPATPGVWNTAIGGYALSSSAPGGLGNTAVGLNSLRHNTTGRFNSALGVNSLLFNSIGSENTAIGYFAQDFNTDGNHNTAVGFGASFVNTTNDDNTAVGWKSLFYNTGMTNCAFGSQALFHNTTGSGNTAVGRQALLSNMIGSQNTANGFQALNSNTSNSYSTAVGYQALLTATGTFNTTLGWGAGKNLTTGGSNIYIGSYGVNGESSAIRLGFPEFNYYQATYIDGIRNSNYFDASQALVFIDSTGRLHVNFSSRRFKKEIKSMDNASEGIFALKPVTFHYKQDEKATPQSFGLIAEDVAEVNPELVTRDPDGTIMGVRYDAVNVMLLNEFLKEHRKVQELEATVAQQQKGMEVLAASLKEQAAQIQKVSAQLELNKRAPRTVANK